MLHQQLVVNDEHFLYPVCFMFHSLDCPARLVNCKLWGRRHLFRVLIDRDEVIQQLGMGLQLELGISEASGNSVILFLRTF